MKKPLFQVLLVTIVVLLGLTVYAALFFYSTSTLPPCCPLLTSQTEADPFETGRGRGFGMMGPGMIGPGMMGSMHVTIDSELDYLTHMIPHHQEAVDTAVYLRDNSDRPEMRTFAEKIIETQSAEIMQMTNFLETWYPDDQHNVDYQPMMRSLENLTGNAVDWTFLEDMIPHHMTAVMMSQQLLARGLAEHEEVAALASSISNSQRNEIHMMMRWLSLWSAEVSETTSRSLPVSSIGIALILLLVFIVLIVLLIILLLSAIKPQGLSTSDSREILDNRYAKGEISREEFLKHRHK